MSPGRSDSSAYRGTSYQKGNIAKFKRNVAWGDMAGRHQVLGSVDSVMTYRNSLNIFLSTQLHFLKTQKLFKKLFISVYEFHENNIFFQLRWILHVSLKNHEDILDFS